MNLPSPGAVLLFVAQQLRSFLHDAEKDIHANREVGTPHQADTAGLYCRTNCVVVLCPTCGPYDSIDADRNEPLYIFDNCVRRRELDRDLNAGEVFRCDATAIGIVVLIQTQRHLAIVLRRELVDEMPHLAVTDDGYFHTAKTAGSGLLKKSPCRRSTAA